MKILSAGKEYIIDETVADVIPDILSVLDKIIGESDKIFCGLLINGQEVYNNFEIILEENRPSLETIEPILITKEQWTVDILKSVHEYTSQSLPKIVELSEKFYGNPSEDAWIQLSHLVEGLQWIQSTTEYLPEYTDLFGSSEQLDNINTAVIQKDIVLIGDIIQYEIVPHYEKIQTLLGEMISNEVTNCDTN